VRFEAASKAAKVIDDGGQVQVVVEWGKGADVIRSLRAAVAAGEVPLQVQRAAQRYTVGVYAGQLQALLAEGQVELLAMMDSEWATYVQARADGYSEQYGLNAPLAHAQQL
jgi:hypothetical protein